ncbi:MAG: hypothetical protein H9535_01065 [Ignavibacteria bacterium]|nr:hypothetical protein [Ignavibacteria bacterium]
MKTSSFLKPALLLVACLFLMNVQSCKDPLQGDIPRVLELVSNGDWQQLTGVNGGTVGSLASSGTTLIIATNGGLFRSQDNGLNWKALDAEQLYIGAVVSSGSTFFAATNLAGKELLRSQDNGTTWQVLQNANFGVYPKEFLVIGSTIIAGGSSGGIMRSTNLGETWQTITLPITPGANRTILSLVTIGNTIFASVANNTLWRSDDNGQSWSMLPNSPPGNTPKLVVVGTTLFAGTRSGISRSLDSGQSWTLLRSLDVYSMVASGSTMIAGTFNGIFRSTDAGATWGIASVQGLGGNAINMLSLVGSTFFAGTSGLGILRSTDGGTSWATSNSGLSAPTVTGITAVGNTLFAGLRGGGLMRSQDNGASWTRTNGNLNNFTIQSLASIGNTIFAGVGQSGTGMYRSSDNGSSWSGVPTNFDVRAICVNGSSIAIAGAVDISLSQDSGRTWRQTTFPNGASGLGNIAIQGSSILVTSSKGVLRSVDNGATWAVSQTGIIPTGSTFFYTRFAVNKSTIIASTTSPDNTFYSRDGGKTWTISGGEMVGKWCTALTAVNDSVFFAGTFADGLFRSKDNGATWTSMNQGKTAPKNITSLFFMGSSVFAGTQNNGVYRLPLR